MNVNVMDETDKKIRCFLFLVLEELLSCLLISLLSCVQLIYQAGVFLKEHISVIIITLPCLSRHYILLKSIDTALRH